MELRARARAITNYSYALEACIYIWYTLTRVREHTRKSQQRRTFSSAVALSDKRAAIAARYVWYANKLRHHYNIFSNYNVFKKQVIHTRTNVNYWDVKAKRPVKRAYNLQNVGFVRFFGGRVCFSETAYERYCFLIDTYIKKIEREKKTHARTHNDFA